MDRRTFVGSLTASILAIPLAAHGQPAGKVWRIGYLAFASLADPPSPERAAFLAGMRELGYVPGGNLDMLRANEVIQ